MKMNRTIKEIKKYKRTDRELVDMAKQNGWRSDRQVALEVGISPELLR